MLALRRKSFESKDQVLQFVAYSNTSMQNVERNSPKMAAKKNTSLLEMKAGQTTQGFDKFMEMQKNKSAGGTGQFFN